MFKQINYSKILNNKKFLFLATFIAISLYNILFSSLVFAADGSLTEEISNQFNNVNLIALAVWYGILAIAGGFVLIAIGKELLPSLFDGNKRQSPKFKEHMHNAIIAVVIIVALALLPIIVPLVVSFFSTFSIDFGSFVSNK